MRRILTIVLTFSLWGCASNPQSTVFVPPAPLPLTLTTFPQVIQSYSEFWLRCMLPEEAAGTAIWGITEHFHSEHKPLDKRMYERLIKAPCEPIVAYCGYRPNGVSEAKMTTLTITPVGECR